MQTHPRASGHAHPCHLRYDDELLRQIIDVELDLWADQGGMPLPPARQAYIDEIARSVQPQVRSELCLHQFVPNHLICLIHEAIRALLPS